MDGDAVDEIDDAVVAYGRGGSKIILGLSLRYGGEKWCRRGHQYNARMGIVLMVGGFTALNAVEGQGLEYSLIDLD